MKKFFYLSALSLGMMCSITGARFPFGILIDVIVPDRLKAFYHIAQGNALGDCHVFLFAPCKGNNSTHGLLPLQGVRLWEHPLPRVLPWAVR